MIISKKNRRQFLASSSGTLLAMPFLESLAPKELLAAGVADPNYPILIHFNVTQGLYPYEISKYLPDFFGTLPTAIKERWFRGMTVGGTPDASWTKRGDHFHTLSLTGSTQVLGSTLNVLAPYKNLMNVYDFLYRSPGNGTHDMGLFLNSPDEIKIPAHVYACKTPIESITTMLSRKNMRLNGLIAPPMPFSLSDQSVTSVSYNGGNTVDTGFALHQLESALAYLFPYRGLTEEQQRSMNDRKKVMLDGVMAAYKAALGRASTSDKRALENYIDSIQTVQNRIAAFKPDLGVCQSPTVPVTNVASADIVYPLLPTYLNAAYDLAILALTCGKASAITFAASSDKFRTHLGSAISSDCANNYHAYGHDTNAVATGAGFDSRLAQIDIVHQDEMSLIKRFIDKLAATSIGGVSLLSRALVCITFDAGAANHDNMRRSMITIGDAGGRIQTGNLISLAKTSLKRNWDNAGDIPASSPATSVYYGLLKGLGIEEADARYGSTFVEGDSAISADRQRSGYPVLLKTS